MNLTLHHADVVLWIRPGGHPRSPAPSCSARARGCEARRPIPNTRSTEGAVISENSLYAPCKGAAKKVIIVGRIRHAGALH